MPSSHYFQLNEIVDLIALTNPVKVLDIGVGFGKYGFLAREYLELWKDGGEYSALCSYSHVGIGGCLW